jgi:hypothetical protein
MTTKEMLTASVTTDCLCENEDGTPASECFDCYEWQKDGVFELLGMWQTLNNITEEDTILINGTGMGWAKQDGYKYTNILELHGALALDGGDFRIEWYWEDGELTARRWSHDEPVGTGLFTFTVFRSCDKCGEPIEKDIHIEELGMCVDCSNKYFDHEDE